MPLPSLRHTLALLWVITVSWLACPGQATSATWNGYEQVEEKHTWQRGDTLADILFKKGLGKEKGPLQLYGARGWIRANSLRNKIKNWSDVAPGTAVYVVTPKVLAQPLVAKAQVPSKTLLPVRPASAKGAPNHVVDAGPEDEDDDEGPSPTEADDADAVEWIEVPKAPAHKPRSLALPLGLVTVVAAVGGVLLHRSRSHAKQLHLRKLHVLLNISTEAYARTCGTMTLAEPSTAEPAEDYQRRVKIALLEAMMVYAGPQLLRLGLLYQELGYFHADTTLLKALQAIGPMRQQSDEVFPPHAPSPQVFTDFLVRLSGQHARIESRIKTYFNTFPAEPKIPPLPTAIQQVNPLPPAYPDALLKLQELGGHGFVKELLDSFVGTTPARLSTLHAAGQAGDAAAVAFEAHALRSSCGSLGAISMSALLQKIETAANAGDLSEVPADIEHLSGEFADVVAVFRYFINDATPKAA